MSSKKCPLLSLRANPEAKTAEALHSCIGEECAWYDNSHYSCAIASMGKSS